jgi:peptide/nickel transport system substrate-binding protein
MESDDSRLIESLLGSRLTRRQILKGAGALGGVMALGPLTSACGGGGTESTPSASAAGTPKKGGNLRIAMGGGSVKDTLDPHIPATEPEGAFAFSQFNGLLEYDNDYKAQYALATEVTPNADATEWTIVLRPDVVFSNGKPFTADDVVYTFQRITNPKDPKQAADQLIGLTPKGISKVDDLTVKFKLTQPNAVMRDALAESRSMVVPVDFDPLKPVGTGPFKLTSYRAGDQADFVPNTDYWGVGPYVDQLSIAIVNDNTARVNSLLGGTADMINAVPPAQIAVVDGSDGVSTLRSKTGAWQPFTMRVDQKPFSDVRVLEAFKLMVDREQMIQQAYGGMGTIGNDMYAPSDPGYPKDLPQRQQDLEKAKSLLKEAGQEGMSIELVTSEALGGDVPTAAQVFAEQAKGAGVKVTVKKLDAGVYWEGYLGYTFSQDFWYTRRYLLQTALGVQPTAPYNEPHWDNDKWLAIVKEGFATVDEAKRNELVTEASTIEYWEQGYIIWAFRDLLDGYSEKLGGVMPNMTGQPMGGDHFNVVYFK